ncbi:MAG TPA: phosphoglycerate mutase family protein [Longimicrobiales bacterium]
MTTSKPRTPRAHRLAVGLALAALAVLPGRGGELYAQDSPVAKSPAPALAPARAQTTVLIVRHAERADGGAGERDPALSEAGIQRAHALAEVAADAGITAIIATQYQRTRLTALPLAEHLGVPVSVVEVGEGGIAAHVAAVAQEIRSKHAGGVVLVVSHSNVVPLIVRELTGLEAPEIADDEYDHLFIVTLTPDAAPRLIRARYGEPTRTPTPAMLETRNR